MCGVILPLYFVAGLKKFMLIRGLNFFIIEQTGYLRAVFISNKLIRKKIDEK